MSLGVIMAAAVAAGVSPKPLPQQLEAQLAAHEGQAVEVIGWTSEIRKGHHVICGVYRLPEDTPEPWNVRPFGQVDGRTILKMRPRWTLVTSCLVHHFNMPLP